MSSISSLFGSDPANVDKSVDSLFKSSSGPVQRALPARTVIEIPEAEQKDVHEDDEPKKVKKARKSEKQSEHKTEQKEHKKQQKQQKQQKDQKHNDDENYDLEAKYFSKLLKEDKPETEAAPIQSKDESDSDSESESDSQDTKTPGTKKSSRAKTIDLKEQELAKAEKTVFVGNVSNAVITSKPVYHQFKKIFTELGPVASIRFRSISFDEAVPRKVAFARKSLHDSRDTVNAYVVFKEKEPSRKAAIKLNATIFDDHHIRVDHITHPAPKDNKRTIFVGNLDFEEREETLWRYFNKHTNQDVEAVRIVRDAKTNLGKGFALIQFKDTLSVNKALLLNDKPIDTEKNKKRKLRISRAKAYAKPSVLSPNHIDNQKKGGAKGGSPLASTSASTARVKKPRHKHLLADGNLTDQQRTKLGRAQSVLGKADRATVGKAKYVVEEGQRAHKGESIKGIKGLKSDRDRKNKGGKVKKPRIRDRSTKFKQERDQMSKEI